MVIVNPDGSLTIEKGDPDFQDIIIGNPDPQNEIIDPDPTKPLSQFVLETFNIPFSLSILGGELPGQDIRNQDATTILKLSLATELLDPPAGSAGFAEVELDEFGIARFYVVGAAQATNLDVRYCIPTSQVTTPADLVIVRGFDPPPRRELRTSFNGLKNAELMDYSECAGGSCDENNVAKFASVSYDDPLLDQVYLDDIVNSFELKAFESLIGYIIDLQLPDGADRDSPNFIQGLKLTFGDTTKEYIKTGVAIFNSTITVGGTSFDATQLTSTLVSAGGGNANLSFGASGQFGGGGSINVSVTVVDEATGQCTQGDVTIAGGKIRIPASRFERLNKFGIVESDFIGVTEVVFAGRKITSIFQIFIGQQVTLDFKAASMSIFVSEKKEFITLALGKNWIWDIDEDGNVEVELFSILETEADAAHCGFYAGVPRFDFVARFGLANPNTPEQIGQGALTGMICNIGDTLGYFAVNNSLCIVVERKRPSIDIFDPTGNAQLIGRQFIDPNGPFGITYTPIVTIDEPAPIAYASTAPLSSIDGTRTIAAEGIIDQADGIVDSDPSTTQDLEDSELSILQDNTVGSTIDITLPFCTDQECLQIARNFLAQQNQVITTQSVVLGPTSEPRLGDIVPDGGIINEITYSYSDSSQYLITITTGPKYLTAGSFNDAKYQLRTEDVTREGVILQDVGNGAEYVVRIVGFGEITALSMILDELSVGDRVNVRIYNNPVEHI